MARRTMALALAGVVMATACASEADGGLTAPDAATTGGELGAFAATPEYLHGVADATTGQSYRIEVDLDMQMSAPGEDSFDLGGQLMTGEVDGERSSMVMDLRSMMEAVAPGDLLAEDLTMTMVTDGEVLYLQAPYFRALADMARSEGATADDLGPLGAVADLGEDEWGRVELGELSLAEVAQTAGAQGASPDVFLEMAAQGTDVEDLGTQDVRGVQARGLGAVATYEQMLEAQGLDAHDAREQFGLENGGGGASDEDVDRVYEALLGLEVPLEVWVDDRGQVVRVTFGLDMGSMMGEFEDIDPEMGGVEMQLDMTMDLFDHGDESIDIQMPTTSTDVTDEFLELMEQGGVGGPAAGPTPS
jgi:hypothetical protein